MLFLILSIIEHTVDHIGVLYPLYSCVFAFLVVLVTYKVHISNPILRFLGKYSFAIYILQRLPMIVLSRTILVNYTISYTIICLILAIIIAVPFTYFTNFVDKFLFSKKTAPTAQKNI